MRPLEGIRVVDLGQAVAGPMCTRELLDLGAEVIKVERPGNGDFSRQYNSDVEGYSSYLVWLNRGKRSIAIDLKTDEGKQILLDLCASADAVVSNFSPAALARVLDDGAIESIAPNLIRCYITGFGREGEFAERKSFDLLIQGESGMTWATGTPGHRAKSGVSLVDLAGGARAASRVLAGLIGASRTGQGTRIDVSLFDIAVDWMTPVLLAEQYGGGAPEPEGLRHSSFVPYGAFDTGDGGHVNIAVQNDRQWSDLCKFVLQRDDISARPDLATNTLRLAQRDAVESEIQAILMELTTAQVVARLEEANLPWGMINDPAQVLHHTQLVEGSASALVRLPDGVTVEVPATTPALESARDGAAIVPRVGQHTRVVLDALGYSAERIDGLYASQIVWTDEVAEGASK